MRLKMREFIIKDIDSRIYIEVYKTIKEILYCFNEYIDNIVESSLGFEPYDESFSVLYDDGTIDVISADYDGHKINKRGIISLVYNNTEDCMVYGPFEINEYGVVSVANEEAIDSNIGELTKHGKSDNA